MTGRKYAVAKALQRVLIAYVEFAVRNHRVRPGRLLGALGLGESPSRYVLLAAGFDQDHRAFLSAVVDPTVGEPDGALGHPAFVRVPLVPQYLAGLEVEAGQITAAVAPLAPNSGGKCRSIGAT